MVDYKKLYFQMFNAMTDALVAMENMNYGTAWEIIKKAQIEAEEACISRPAPADADLK